MFIWDYVLLCSLFQQAKHFQQAFGSSGVFLDIFFFSICSPFVLLTVPVTLLPVIFSNITTQDLDFFVQLHYHHYPTFPVPSLYLLWLACGSPTAAL